MDNDKVSLIKKSMSKEEILKLLKVNDEVVWNRCGDNYDIIETKKMFANDKEINLFSDIFLMDDVIILVAPSFSLGSIVVKHLRYHKIVKMQFLDNSENKGAALIITIQSRGNSKTISYLITSKDAELVRLSGDNIVLTIPIENCDKDSIIKIKKRLNRFCGNYYGDNGLLEFTDLSFFNLEIINFLQFNKYIKPLNLKGVSFSPNDLCKTKSIFIINDDFSIKNSKTILDNFLSSKKNLSNGRTSLEKNDLSDDEDEIFNDQIDSKLFESKNVENNGKYDVNFKSYGSLFEREWLHCDIIDTYLNEWRKRMGDVICNPEILNYPRIKIYDTFFFTRLIRGVRFKKSGEFYNEYMASCFENNIRRIACEKIYRLSPVCRSIFDFDIVIIPICIEEHWITGVIYKPINCLIERLEENNNSMEIEDVQTTIFIYDSLHCERDSHKRCCFTVLKKYIEACYSTLKENLLKKKWFFDEKKIKFTETNDPWFQKNGYDCGLFMLEFIRNILIDPKLLEKFIYGNSMINVLPNFNVSQSRNFLKSFVFSKIKKLETWKALYEFEQKFLVKYYGKKVKTLRSQSVTTNTRVSRISKRNRTCSC